MQVESIVPSEPQVRTGTLYLSVSGVSRWWGQAVLSGGRTAKRSQHDSTVCPHHRLTSRIIAKKENYLHPNPKAYYNE